MWTSTTKRAKRPARSPTASSSRSRASTTWARISSPVLSSPQCCGYCTHPIDGRSVIRRHTCTRSWRVRRRYDRPSEVPMKGGQVPDTTVTSADGTTLALRRSGQGSPIVLVHGANGDLDTFALIEGLLAERHSVWVYSRRGRGGSSDGSDYTLGREVEDVLAVLDAAGRNAHLLGHSGGALYCLFAAAEAASLRSLVLYEPPFNL